MSHTIVESNFQNNKPQFSNRMRKNNMNTIGKMTMFKLMLSSQKTLKVKREKKAVKKVKVKVKKVKVKKERKREKEKVIGISKTNGMTINGINRNNKNNKNNKHNKKVRQSKERVVVEEEMKKKPLWTTKTTEPHMMQSKTGRENQGIN